MKKIFLLLILFQFFVLSIYAQSQSQPYTNNIKIDEQLTVYTHSSMSNRLSESEKELLQILKDAQNIKYEKGIADIYARLYTVNFLKAEFGIALKYAQSAQKIYNKLGKKEEEAQMLAYIGWSMFRLDNKESEMYFNKAINLARKIHSDSVLTWSYDNYGVVLQQRNKDSAIINFNKSLRLKLKNKDYINAPFSYYKIASVEMERKNFEAAEAALSNAKKYLDPKEQYITLEYYAYLGDLQFAKGEFNNASQSFRQSKAIAEEINMPFLIAYNLQMLAETESKLGNFKDAYLFKTQEKSLRDSVMNIQKIESLQKLQTEFDTEKNLKEIAIQNQKLALQEKDKYQLDLKVTRRTNLLYIILLVSAVVLAFVFFILRRNQLKSKIDKQNAIIEKERLNYQFSEEKNRISRELHDNIGSQLTFMISAMENLSYSEDIEVEKLNKISEFGRETLTELRSTVWAINEKAGNIETVIDKLKTLTLELPVDIVCSAETAKGEILGTLMLNILRVIQEFTQNTIKYADAKNIIILFEKNQGDLKITMSDNGKGFNTEHKTFGNGIFNMKKRIEDCKGTCQLYSDSHGTELRMEFPNAVKF